MKSVENSKEGRYLAVLLAGGSLETGECLSSPLSHWLETGESLLSLTDWRLESVSSPLSHCSLLQLCPAEASHQVSGTLNDCTDLIISHIKHLTFSSKLTLKNTIVIGSNSARCAGWIWQSQTLTLTWERKLFKKSTKE